MGATKERPHAAPGMEMNAERHAGTAASLWHAMRKLAEEPRKLAGYVVVASMLAVPSHAHRPKPIHGKSAVAGTVHEYMGGWIGSKPVFAESVFENGMYDSQVGETFGKDAKKISYRLEAVAQPNKDIRHIGYFINGLTDRGTWVQLGLVDFKKHGYEVERHAADISVRRINFEYGIVLEVFNGTSVGPAIIYKFGKPINTGDNIALTLKFNGRNDIVAKAEDITANEAIAISIPGEYGLGGRFIGADSMGPSDGMYFTGLMTEAKESSPRPVQQAMSTYESLTGNPSPSVAWSSYMPYKGNNAPYSKKTVEVVYTKGVPGSAKGSYSMVIGGMYIKSRVVSYIGGTGLRQVFGLPSENDREVYTFTTGGISYSAASAGKR
ncbi:MAG: hypothetical protein ACREBH_04545 [Candidatus Micrarchaeaceae archaeon]